MLKFLTILFLISCNSSNHLKIIINDSVTYQQNKDTINEAVQFYQNHCEYQSKVDLELKFDFMPIELVSISLDKIAITTPYSDLTIIEINPYRFNYMNDIQRKNTIYHEIGHAIGLEHSNDPQSIMYNENTDILNLNKLQNEIKNYCKSMKNVPRFQKII